MHPNTPQGEMVVCVKVDGPTPEDTQNAKLHLTLGRSYTVKKIDHPNGDAYVTLKEVFGETFNIVHFRNIPNPTE